MDNIKTQKLPCAMRAGVAKSDITSSEPGVEILDSLYAKALVLDDGVTKVVIITMDVTAIGGRKISCNILDDVGEEFLPALRARIEKELNIPGCNVLVNASHTHPPGRMLCDDAEQLERTFDAVRQAAQNMTQVKIGCGSGYENRLTINRTLKLKNGLEWSIRHTNPSPPKEEVAASSPIDPEIGLLKIDRLDGRTLAVVYNFACHPLFGDAKGSITANFPGVASKVIEENLDDDTMALFIQGAGGNIIDSGFKNFNQPRDIKPMGTKLGLSALDAIKKISTKGATLNVISEIIELPRRTDIPERIAALLREQTELLASLHGTTLNFEEFFALYTKYDMSPDNHQEKDYSDMDKLNRRNIRKYLQSLNAMEKLAQIQDKISTLEKHQIINDRSGETTIKAEVMGIKIGDCVIISSPAELLVEIGLNLKKISPYKTTLVAAFSNGYIHYGPPAEAYDKGGYEVTECLLAPEWENIYKSTVKEIFEQL
ncbi:MAG: hypothetical protein WC071_09115 [Victivallaceae bacterium]